RQLRGGRGELLEEPGGARRLAVGEDERRRHEDDRRCRCEPREEVARATRAEERLAAAAEHGAHVGAFAGLEEHHHDQEEAGEDVDGGNDVVEEQGTHQRDSSNCTMRAKLAASRLAPPTSAPSMSTSVINASMLSGLTLPPYRIRTPLATAAPARSASSPRIAPCTSCAWA